MHPIQDTITIEQFRDLFKRTDERTATSPAGVHIGHYIVATESVILSTILTKCLNIPIEGHFSPEKWKTSIHTMIPKDPDNIYIDRLRIIQLLEPDYNGLMKMKINKELMYHPETENILGNDMHGGRQHRTAHDAMITQQLLINIAAQQQRSVTILNLDASKCYDRIFPNIANIALRRLGLPKGVTNAFTKTLVNMKHHVKTIYGISKQYIPQEKTEYLQE